MNVERATEIVNETTRLLLSQKQLVDRLKADGADTTEAEHQLACFAAAHVTFESCLKRAIRDKAEKAVRNASNLAFQT
jgi:hypothetical protein